MHKTLAERMCLLVNDLEVRMEGKKKRGRKHYQMLDDIKIVSSKESWPRTRKHGRRTCRDLPRIQKSSLTITSNKSLA